MNSNQVDSNSLTLQSERGFHQSERDCVTNSGSENGEQFRFQVKRAFIVSHDLVMTTLAIFAALYVRFDNAAFLAKRVHLLAYALPAFLALASCVYAYFRLYTSKWRFASLPDLWNIVKAVTILALALLITDYVLVSSRFYGDLLLGKITIGVYWIIQIFLLGGPRIAYRLFRYHRTHIAIEPDASQALVLGRTADAEILLRAVESGAVKKIRPIGILSPSSADQRQVLRGIKVLGRLGNLEEVVRQLEARGQPIKEVIFTASALLPESQPDVALTAARRMGVTVRRLPSLDMRGDIRLAALNVEDLLLRPSVRIDHERLLSFVRGKAIIVTGGGGSIGSELCDRVLNFEAARLLIIDHSELALYSAVERLKTKSPSALVEGRIADVRDRERMLRLFSDFRPDVVFHSAALKHVPILEHDCEEGIRTNVFGTRNVADAAVAAQAAVLAMISTDKAIEPVSILGASKRLAEIYCQALDTRLASRAGLGDRPTQLISVRFGNVLASNGSVVPKFKAQIDAGGPVTVTHPEMVRYFMTIREACDLVITACSHALGPNRSAAAVYVLEMGQPVKILDLAERMIRLSGLEPGRDIDIIFTGVRPGERLHEVLFATLESAVDIGLPGIAAAKTVHASLDEVMEILRTLEQTIASDDRTGMLDVLHRAVPDFNGTRGSTLPHEPVSHATNVPMTAALR